MLLFGISAPYTVSPSPTPIAIVTGGPSGYAPYVAPTSNTTSGGTYTTSGSIQPPMSNLPPPQPPPPSQPYTPTYAPNTVPVAPPPYPPACPVGTEWSDEADACVTYDQTSMQSDTAPVTSSAGPSVIVQPIQPIVLPSPPAISSGMKIALTVLVIGSVALGAWGLLRRR